MDPYDSMSADPRQIHVVEDHDLVRSLLSAWLTSKGHRVRAYGTEDTLSLNGVAPGDLVLLDLCLGDTDGLDVLQSLAEQGFAGDIVLISAFPQPVIEAAQAVGRDFGLHIRGALRKPLDFDRLTELLRDSDPRGRRDSDASDAMPPLAEALAADRVIFHFQPILDAITLEVRSIEMLARLIDKTGGERSIGALLTTADIATLHGLAGIAFDAVGDIARLLERRGLPQLPIAINIPSSLLQRQHFPPMLERARHANAEITLEISELDSFGSLADARRVTTSAVLHGLRFSLDDFGTLNSNVDRFSQIPFDELKIDRAYVSGCSADPFRDTVCRFGVELAHLRHAVVVAEGVETNADLEHLRAIGVDRVQGYLFSQPLPSDAFVDWIAAHQTETFAPAHVRRGGTAAGGGRA